MYNNNTSKFPIMTFCLGKNMITIPNTNNNNYSVAKFIVFKSQKVLLTRTEVKAREQCCLQTEDSRISARFKSHFRWIDRKSRHWKSRDRKLSSPSLTSPEETLTGSGPDQKWSRVHAQPVPALFSYYITSSCRCAENKTVNSDFKL
jgi:hypothetical protein